LKRESTEFFFLSEKKCTIFVTMNELTATYQQNTTVLPEAFTAVDTGSQKSPGKINGRFFQGLDYYPFGSLMPGRNLNASDYRFGYQGSEVDDEIKGNRNTITTYYREASLDVGQWWSPDPKQHPSWSPYAMMGRNPIFYNDVLGDTLDVADNEASKKDINSLVKTDNQKYITFTDGRVGLDFGDLDDKERADLLKNDEGLSLINDLVSSNKKILYEASDVVLIRDEEGNKLTGLTYSLPYNIVNASEGGKDAIGGRNYRPKEGYQGQVIIHPDAQFEEFNSSGTVIKKSRSSIVFHELEENYQRTHNGVDYNGKSGAHNLAKTREGKWHGKSYKPGEISKIIPGSKPSATRLKEIGEINKKYMGWK
jgi:RHS repeat-associated protein